MRSGGVSGCVSRSSDDLMGARSCSALGRMKRVTRCSASGRCHQVVRSCPTDDSTIRPQAMWMVVRSTVLSGCGVKSDGGAFGR